MGDSRSPLRYIGNDGKNGFIGNDGEGGFEGTAGKMASSGMTGKMVSKGMTGNVTSKERQKNTFLLSSPIKNAHFSHTKKGQQVLTF